jgi:hypothetical protein
MHPNLTHALVADRQQALRREADGTRIARPGRRTRRLDGSTDRRSTSPD